MNNEKADRMIELLERIDKNIELMAKIYRVSIAGALVKAKANEKLKKPPTLSSIQSKMHDRVKASDEIKIELTKVV